MLKWPEDELLVLGSVTPDVVTENMTITITMLGYEDNLIVRFNIKNFKK